MAEGPSQYKSSTEQERIARQVIRDLERPSARDEISGGGLSRGRLSQSTKRALDDPETRDWVRSVINQKAAQLGANNFSLDRTTVRVSQTSKDTPVFVEDSAQGSISASASGGGDENFNGGGGGAGLPAGATAKEFDVCENGQAKTYWFVVWEQEPNLTPPETEQ